MKYVRLKKKIFCVVFILLINLATVKFFSMRNEYDTVQAISRYGSKGDEVVKIQTKLKEQGYYTGKVDGIFGNGTRSALIEYQKANNLAADGIAGDKTLSSLGIAKASTSSQSDQVKAIQTKLKEKGYYNDNVDGILGSKTKSAIKAFQKDNGLVVDGIAGPKTLEKLNVSANKDQTSKNPSTDADLLARVISSEARGEPYTGQVAVGAVILNRVEHPSFPNTLAGVVYQPGAFTCMVDGQINEATAESSKRAAQDAINGWDPSGGAIYYYNPDKSTNQWIFSRPVITVIGKHRFCN